MSFSFVEVRRDAVHANVRTRSTTTG